jgi:hypothetical protein
MTNQTKRGHGGKREGAGRHAWAKTQSVSFRLPVETVQLLWEKIESGDRAKWTNQVLLEALRRK